MELTKFGLWIGRSVAPEQYGEAARLAEELGYGALWVGGSPRLPKLRPMLEASERIVIASGIVNVWAYDPAELAEEFAAIDSDFPGRLLLGIGIGHPESTQEYEKPLTKTRGFLDAVAGSAHPVARERMALAALGPKMLDLSFERTLGTHPYFTTPAHTAFARERLGAAALVAPEQAVVIDRGDAEAAYRTARGYADMYLRLSNYTNNLKRFGYGDADIADGGTRALIDDVVPQGSPERVAAAARAHLDAGADHVCVQTLQPSGTKGVPADDWRALAAELIR
ncbi:MAG TPA: TIGR03620 family F420-dependent LLM class oxidoreductase [Solirubrobacteraceae bacterium]|jgi:probable F420-dependent oxidoreductase|nr:TIGR03620 family F420-dependent LLM class oxidoreductase [Solirubrobacteraceae bacterium]